MKKLAIVIPAHNEEKRIERTLSEFISFFSKKQIEYEILVVINNTFDKTEQIVKKYTGKNVNYLNLKKGGKGYAVVHGFLEELKKGFDVIGFVDADLATSPSAFYDLYLHLNCHHGIIASRYIHGSNVRPPPSLARVLTSRLFNSLIRGIFLIPYRDTQCGAKIFKKEPLEKILPNLTMSQWAFDVDLIYNLRKKGFKIKEHPTSWSDREYSKINLLRAGPRMVLAIIRLRIINSPLKGIVRLYDELVRIIGKFI